MASASEIMLVRGNVADVDDSEYMFEDDVIVTLIDELGVNSASAALWRRKAGIYAELVNTSEGGSTRALSDLHKNALTLASSYDKLLATGDSDSGSGSVATGDYPRVTKIVRQ